MLEQISKDQLIELLKTAKMAVETVFGNLSDDFPYDHRENPRTGGLIWEKQKEGMRWELLIAIVLALIENYSIGAGAADEFVRQYIEPALFRMFTRQQGQLIKMILKAT